MASQNQILETTINVGLFFVKGILLFPNDLMAASGDSTAVVKKARNATKNEIFSVRRSKGPS